MEEIEATKEREKEMREREEGGGEGGHGVVGVTDRVRKEGVRWLYV